MKKWFFLVLVVILAAGMIGCPAILETPPPQQPTTISSEIKAGLKLRLSVPKMSYHPGEELKATLSLINTTPDTISFSTRTSQLFDLLLEGPEKERRWSEDKAFLMVITAHDIPAGGTLSRTLSLKVGRIPGEAYLTGVTVPLDLNGELIRLQTRALKLKIE